ncbi:MAG: hypothetical protein GYA15_12305 [Leptolinea sp.]|nr:hypothetical protein [Leptolinea sp.]
MENYINKVKAIVNNREKRTFLICFSLLFFFLAILVYFVYPVQEHWQSIFRPAALEILHFRNPYTVEKFFNPPWALLPIIPFAVLPERLGNALWAATSIATLGFVFKKLGASWLLTLAFLLLPFTLYNMVQVNIDWIVALGFLLSPRWALFLILLKPQIGGLLAIYWGIEAWKREESDRSRMFLDLYRLPS